MARRESEPTSHRSRQKSPTVSYAERPLPDSAEPLLDADWLLGPPRRSILSNRKLVGAGTLSILCIVLIASAPTFSRAWLRHQLAEQFRGGATLELRKEGLIGLAKLLPESLSDIVAGFARSDRREAEFVYHALSEYLDGLTKLPIEVRRAKAAEVVYRVEAALQIVSPEAVPLVEALTTSIQDGQAGDKHPAAAVTLASCDRILKHWGSVVPETSSLPVVVASKKKAESATSFRLSDTSGENPVVASTAGLRDDTSVLRPSSYSFSDSSTETSAQEAASVEPLSDNLERAQDTAAPTVAHATMQPMVFTPIEHSNDTSRVSTSKEGITLRQRLLKANRFVPISGGTSVEIESTSGRTDASSSEEVRGIERQRTQDLLGLLASVQPRIAQAAFHELESRRLSREELELAVELARGSTERRIAAMEKLVTNPKLDPLNWLTWMAGEADREVRFKAVSLLGSLNNDEAKKQLRLMSGRERDQEISRHIQQALVANGFSPASNR